MDWPLSHDDLRPYYDRAEALMGVTGTNGIPPHPPTNLYKVLHAGATRLGYSTISNAHIAINSETRDDRPACIQMGFCNQGCKINAKWSSLASLISKAEATGRMDLRTEAMAQRIEHDDSGRASAVIYRDREGALHRQRAALVCVAGNALETARLLLLSDSPTFRDGLANTHGHVGRHYTRHVSDIAMARLPKPVNMHRGIVTPGTIFDEARHDPSRGFAGGYLMEATSLAPVTLAMLIGGGDWGKDFAQFMEHYDHMAGMLMVGEELPRSDNRVTLSDTVKDAAGMPMARGAGMPVIFTRYVYQPDYSDGGVMVKCLLPELAEHEVLQAGTDDTEVISELDVQSDDIVIDKNRPSSFYKTDMDAVLEKLGVSQLVVCGVTTNCCVESTVRDASHRDFEVFVVGDACGELDEERHRVALRSMDMLFADVIDRVALKAALGSRD